MRKLKTILVLALVLIVTAWSLMARTNTGPHVAGSAHEIEPKISKVSRTPAHVEQPKIEARADVECSFPSDPRADGVYVTLSQGEAPLLVAVDGGRFFLPSEISSPGEDVWFRFETADQRISGKGQLSAGAGCTLLLVSEKNLPELETRCPLALKGLDEQVNLSDLELSAPVVQSGLHRRQRMFGLDVHDKVAEAYIENSQLVIQGGAEGRERFSVGYVDTSGVPVVSAQMEVRWTPESCSRSLSSVGYVWITVENDFEEDVSITGCMAHAQVDGRIGLIIPANTPCTLRARRDDGMNDEFVWIPVEVAEGEHTDVTVSFPDAVNGDAGIVVVDDTIVLVYTNSAGKAAGLMRGDTVLAVNQQDVGPAGEALTELMRALPGETVAWTVERDGEVMDFDVLYGTPYHYNRQ